MPHTRIVSLLLLGFTLVAPIGCGGGSEAVVSSRAYKGHENDLDMNAFVNAFKKTLGTRLDDCQTCHTGFAFTTGSGTGQKTVNKNACDYCHLIQHPDATGFNEPQPTTYAETLNPFGKDYAAAGRSQKAFGGIKSKDSDGDGYDNQAEIADLKYPGDAASKPGQKNPTVKAFTMEQLKALTAHQEFMLANASKQQYDFYATYKGVKVKDLLTAAGVDPTDPNLTGVTVIAPDGFMKDFPVAKINSAYPAGVFYGGLDTATLPNPCGFVQYPDQLPAGVVDGQPIPGEQWLMLAYERDGLAIDPSSLDPTSGKINGEGPYRIIVPQSTPGAPDRGSQYPQPTCGDSYDYDQAKDHNAGDMVRGVIAIRINPLPAGVEDFDAKNGGWAYIANSTVLLYGYGIEKP
ncbi:MAG: hypothetical protein GYA21_13500 [Myxococcales bacterium]|nr:hypothetical protein [Myxococcales bacterium]